MWSSKESCYFGNELYCNELMLFLSIYLVVLRNSPGPVALKEQIGEDAVFWLFEAFSSVVFRFRRVLAFEHVEFFQIALTEEAADLLLVEHALRQPLLLHLSPVDFFFHRSLRHQSAILSLIGGLFGRDVSLS